MKSSIIFKSLIVGLVLMTAASLETNAQSYGSAIGLRLGPHNGLTYKTFMGGNKAFEGLFTSYYDKNNNGFNGWKITGLLEFDVPLGSDGLSFLYGFGGHIGSWAWDGNTRATVLGVDGIVGLEFTIPNAPICLQLDWKPTLELAGYNYWGYDGFALSARYILK